MNYQFDLPLNGCLLKTEIQTTQSPKIFGEYCDNNDQCFNDLVCVNNICGCIIGFYFDVTVKNCVPLKSHNDACLKDSECNNFKNLRCNDQKCSCKEYEYYSPLQQICGNFFSYLDI